MNIYRLMHCRRALNRSLVIASLVLLQFACSANNDASLVYDSEGNPNPLGPTLPNSQPPVTTDPDDESLWIINGGVEDGVKHWRSRGDAHVSISQSSEQAYAGNHSLFVEGRTDNWHGAEMDLPKNLPTNTFRASVWVRLAAGEEPTTVKLTMERKEHDHPVGHPNVAQGVATSNQWVQLTGTFSHESTNTLEIFLLYIEAENTTASYYVDELTLVVADPGGPLHPSDPAGWIINGDVESGVAPWRGNPGNVLVTQETEAAHGGDYSLLVTGRADTWHGPVMDLPKTLPADRTYQASVWVRLAPGVEATDMQLTMKRQLVDQPDGEDGIYLPIDLAEQVTDEAWVQLLGTFDHPPFEGDLADFYFYIEATDPLASYYVDDLELANAGELVFNSGLEASALGWAGFGASVERTDNDAHLSDWSLLVKDRTETWQGGSFTFAALSLDYSYNISCWAKMAPDNPTTKLALSLKITQGEEESYVTIAELDEVTSATWVQLSDTYVYQLDNPDLAVTDIFGYVEAPENETAEYLIDDCSITLQ